MSVCHLRHITRPAMTVDFRFAFSLRRKLHVCLVCDRFAGDGVGFLTELLMLTEHKRFGAT